MKHTIETSWNTQLQFTSQIDSHKIVIDANSENGGEDKGPSPKKLMLSALAGCTGIDVVSILNKMKVPFTNLSIVVDANVTEDHPKHYNEIHIIYKFSGNNLNLEKIEKAIQLSQEKYCGVFHVYKQVMKMSSNIELYEE